MQSTHQHMRYIDTDEDESVEQREPTLLSHGIEFEEDSEEEEVEDEEQFDRENDDQEDSDSMNAFRQYNVFDNAIANSTDTDIQKLQERKQIIDLFLKSLPRRLRRATARGGQSSINEDRVQII